MTNPYRRFRHTAPETDTQGPLVLGGIRGQWLQFPKCLAAALVSNPSLSDLPGSISSREAPHSSDPGVLYPLTQTSSPEVLVTFSSLQELFQANQPATTSMVLYYLKSLQTPVSLSG